MWCMRPVWRIICIYWHRSVVFICYIWPSDSFTAAKVYNVSHQNQSGLQTKWSDNVYKPEQQLFWWENISAHSWKLPSRWTFQSFLLKGFSKCKYKTKRSVSLSGHSWKRSRRGSPGSPAHPRLRQWLRPALPLQQILGLCATWMEGKGFIWLLNQCLLDQSSRLQCYSVFRNISCYFVFGVFWSTLLAFSCCFFKVAWAPEAAPNSHCSMMQVNHSLSVFGFQWSLLDLQVQARQVQEPIMEEFGFFAVINWKCTDHDSLDQFWFLVFVKLTQSRFLVILFPLVVLVLFTHFLVKFKTWAFLLTTGRVCYFSDVTNAYCILRSMCGCISCRFKTKIAQVLQ